LVLFGLIGLWVLLRRRDNKNVNPGARPPPLSDHDEAEDATIPSRLEELEEMLQRGEITDEEYASRRRHLLGDEDEGES
ncbi:MAG: SHOCT domain-containing protein, partial [Alphaproteobacteria bacterium]|nr:SHOCT domain-containing protein [Alphaproteobacteria bacterium]